MLAFLANPSLPLLPDFASALRVAVRLAPSPLNLSNSYAEQIARVVARSHSSSLASMLGPLSAFQTHLSLRTGRLLCDPAHILNHVVLSLVASGRGPAADATNPQPHIAALMLPIAPPSRPSRSNPPAAIVQLPPD
jgi:hypothetical protein